MEWVVGILAAIGGGSISIIVQAIANKGKTKVESESVLVKSALDIEEIAMNRYTTAEQKLNKIKAELDEVKGEMAHDKRYISYLVDLLIKNNIKYLSAEEIRHKGTR